MQYDGKKWVKFVAMQQDSVNLIYDLTHNEKCSGELPSKTQPLKTVQFQAWKMSPIVLKVSKKKTPRKLL